MVHKLNEIIEDTKKAIAVRKEQAYLEYSIVRSGFADAISGTGMHIIAEVKSKSPSHGSFQQRMSIVERVRLYESAGAAAISYVSNFTFFGGQPKMIEELKKHTSLPILQKDFVIDEFQVHEAAYYCADALLLIARIVDTQTLHQLVSECHKRGIEPVVEVYDEDDLIKIKDTEAQVIGVNARNLDTLEMDLEKAYAIMKKVSNKTVIGFSGIQSKKEVDKYKDAGASAVLVGSALMDSENIASTIQSLL